MTAEQLEELLGSCSVTNIHGYSEAFEELRNLAPSLARRVIAAEKLVEALGKIEKSWPELRKGLTDFGERQEFSHALASNLSIARDALTAYREASK